MRAERWPGEPLHERLTIAERLEVQDCYMRQWLGRKRRQQWELRQGHTVLVKKYDMHGRRTN